MKEKYLLDLSAEDGYFRDYMAAKGYFPNAVVVYEGKKYLLNLYDNVRLRQDLDREFKGSEDVFFEKNILVLGELTLANIRDAISAVILRDNFQSFVAE